VAVAREALEAASGALPAYSHPYSPKTYTQHQLVAMLAVREFLRLDYRSTQQMLQDWSDLREAIKLDEAPHWTTLEKAEKRILKKGASTTCSTRSSRSTVEAA
jgi:hypothetical protein